MAEKAPSASRFWQAWTFLGVLGTALAGARVLRATIPTIVQPATQASTPAERQTARQAFEAPASPAASDDRLLLQLARAATASERCTLLARVPPSEDERATYAITTLLERARLGSVRLCATEALGRQPTPEARSWLVDLSEDPQPEVHRAALEALAARDEAARAVVVEAAHSEDLELRSSAVAALLKGKRPEAYAAATLLLPLIEDSETHSFMIDALGQSQDPRALPVLEALLDDAERESYLRAISALGDLGVPSAAGRLEALLQTGSSEEFRAAAEALQKLDRHRLATRLRSMVASENNQRQQFALEAMLSLGLPDSSSIVREQLRSEDATRTLLVLRHLIGRPDPSFEPELIAIVQREDPRSLLTAMQALSKLSTPSARAALQRVTSSLPESVAERFLDQTSDSLDQARERRIAALDHAENVHPETLVKLARDPAQPAQDALLRYLEGHEVAAELWANVIELSPESTVKRLIDRRTRSSESEKLGLLQGLGRRGDPRFADTLRAELRGDQRISALSALAQLGDDSLFPQLQQLAKTGDASERNLAVQLLSTRPEHEAVQELERLASDPDVQVMGSALQALQSRSPERVPRLAERALRTASAEDRGNVLSALSELKASLSRPLLELALADADDSVAVEAIELLGNLQGPASAQRLLSLVNDTNRSAEVRRQAASRLRMLGGPLARSNAARLDSLSEPEAPPEFACNSN